MQREVVFLGGQSVSLLGDGLALLAVPLLVLGTTQSPALAVLASLPGSAGYVVAGLPAGVVADRVDPWRLLMAGDAIRAALFGLLFWLTGAAVPAGLILALAFAAGVVTVFSDTALDIAVRDVFAGPRLVTANSWLESASQGGQLIGPAATGLLAAAGLLHVSLLIDAITFGVALVTVVVVRGGYRVARRPRQAAVTVRALLGEVAGGFRYLAGTRLLRTLLVFILVLNFCLGADKLVIFFARSTLHLPPGQVGLVVTAGGAGGLLGAAATSALCRRLGALPVITACSALTGVALLGMSAAASTPALLAANAAYFWAIVAASVALRALRQSVVSRDMLGRVTASWRLGGQGVTLLGGALAGVTAAACGSPRPVLAVAGGLTLATVAVAWTAGLRTHAPSPGPATGPSPGAAPGPGPR